MGNVFVNQGGVLKRVCIKENFNPACCDSRLTCGQRPVENCCTAHNTATAGCAWSHPGESSGSCVPWNPAHCGAETKNHCVLQATNHNVAASNPRCKSGWTGSCSYRCNDGNFDKITNTCKKNCSSKEFPIAGTVCRLPASNHHATARINGTCTSSYGECSGRCNNGNWQGVANTCYTPRECDSITPKGCKTIPGLSHNGTTAPGCASGYTGSCSANCNDGSLSVTNSCTQARGCSAKTLVGCTIPTLSHGGNTTPGCANNYAGSCSARCSNGELTVTNSCECTTGVIDNCKTVIRKRTGQSALFTSYCVLGYSGWCGYSCFKARNDGSGRVYKDWGSWVKHTNTCEKRIGWCSIQTAGGHKTRANTGTRRNCYDGTYSSAPLIGSFRCSDGYWHGPSNYKSQICFKRTGSQ